ncbi:MAG TPA: VWA domain-containing protein [Urbifossiella sp.]|nr:VWA domain-containing protein [Urbifossiella sp.]
MSANDVLARWRLVLGKFAQPRMPDVLTAEQQRMADALDQLYGREYRGRGVRQGPKLGPGSLDPSQLNVPTWLNELRELFPQQTCERITKHALDRYGMTEIVQDPETLAKLEPSAELLAAVLSLKGQMRGPVLVEARRLIARVVEEVRRKLEREILGALTGRLNRFRKCRHKVARNFDARCTVRRNLKNWDPGRKKLVVEDPQFFNRVRRHLPWEIILCVDQSGSMADSVIHSAVMAGILAGLPAVRVRLVVFDTAIVDLSEHASDPVEVLMSVQLGGGTNIGAALRYCEQLVSQPRRTILVLVTDFCEGADPRELVAAVRRLRGAGVRLLGLAALDGNANPFYDVRTAGQLAAEGMEIAALTPERLAHWLATAMDQG